MADRFGARTVFRAAIVVFTLGSILCGLSSSLTGFVLARIVQGVGGAMMVPVGRLLLLRSVDARNLVRALAYLTLPALLGPMLGPPLGGFITTYFHWRWIFWINVPIGVLGVTLATLFIHDVREEAVPASTSSASSCRALGLSCLIFGLTILGRGFLPAWQTAALMAGGAVLRRSTCCTPAARRRRSSTCRCCAIPPSAAASRAASCSASASAPCRSCCR